MGLIGWAEVHPFTIASVAKTPDGLVLLCKNAGGWTKRLYEMAKVAGYGCEDGDATRMVTVMLDGPYGVAFPYSPCRVNVGLTLGTNRWYGTLGICEFFSCDVCRWRQRDHVCTVCNPGSCSGELRSWVVWMVVDSGDQRDYEDSSRVKVIELIWCIQDPCAFIFLLLETMLLL